MHKFLEAKWTAASTFNLARSAISDMYRYSYNIRIGESDLVCATINNISQYCRQSSQKQPLTKEIMERICAVINVNNRDQVRNYYMMLLMMASFLREAEIVLLEMERVKIIYDNPNTNNNTYTNNNSISIIDNNNNGNSNGMNGSREVGLEIEHMPFKKKNKQYRKKIISSAPSNLVMDVVTWHKCYMKYVDASSSLYLFHDVRNGAKLASNTPWHIFKSLFKLAGIDFKFYGSHSARRGGATAAFEAGVSVEMIKQHGNWVSNAVEKYLRPNQQTLMATTSFLNNTSIKQHTQINTVNTQ